MAAGVAACLTVSACSSSGKGGLEQAHFLPPGGSLPATVIPLPPQGSPSYPKAVYPASVVPKRRTGVIYACPSTLGLQIPGSSAANDAATILAGWGSVGFSRDLHNTDRAMWSEVRTEWATRDFRAAPSATSTPILYSGPLSGQSRDLGAPDPSSWVMAACGEAVYRLSYLVQTGSAVAPSRQSDWVFVQRRGHLLLYLTY